MSEILGKLLVVVNLGSAVAKTGVLLGSKSDGLVKGHAVVQTELLEAEYIVGYSRRKLLIWNCWIAFDIIGLK
jgi:hypothetical protein